MRPGPCEGLLRSRGQGRLSCPALRPDHGARCQAGCTVDLGVGPRLVGEDGPERGEEAVYVGLGGVVDPGQADDTVVGVDVDRFD